MKILVVDDNDEVAAVFVDALTEAGFEVDQKVTAYEAIVQAFKTRYDIVLMDLILHSYDSLSALSSGDTRRGEQPNGAVAALAMRGLGLEMPILVITGGLLPIDEDIYKKIRFAGKLLKPVLPTEIVAEVRRQLKLVQSSGIGENIA